MTTTTAKDALHAQVEHNLTNHPPVAPEIIEAMEEVRSVAKNLGHTVIGFCPIGRDLSLALTHIEDATMHAIAAIARGQADLLGSNLAAPDAD
jgi:hypothetical protein